AIQGFLLKHQVIGPFVAALVTPTSNALVPVVESSWKIRSLQPMCLYYLQSSVMMSLPLFMLRQIGFRDAKDIPIKMYIMGLIVSLAMLVFMRPAFWLTEALCDYSGSAWTTILATVRAIL
ncbi:MAG: hypothetical protein KGJ33_02140, partial [Patescibacteria group bacterium]|nr:hypothetical protein [Patescibacteria group bacterium]